ncbi:MAG: hypothetical protein AABW88_03065 [Nanoarchaeota archaeon]
MKFKYPKFILFFVTIILAYLFYKKISYGPINNVIINLGYVGSFIAGMLYSFSFGAAFSVALLIVFAKTQNILIAGLIAGIGALLSDLLIFKFIRHSFANEIASLSKERMVWFIGKNLPIIIKKKIVHVVGWFIVGSPLPDEIGIAMLASSKMVSTKMFMTLSYLLNTAGIFVVLLIGV